MPNTAVPDIWKYIYFWRAEITLKKLSLTIFNSMPVFSMKIVFLALCA